MAVAFDGAEGLRLGKSNVYDMMQLDILLPRIDRFHVIRMMHEDHIRTPAIINSARDSMQHIVYVLDAGVGEI